MPNSQFLVDTLKTVIQTDLQSQQSIISYFTSSNLSGGWEAWLQTVFAYRVFAQRAASDFNREVVYTGTALRCDLWFQGGTGIWVELKTQRRQNYANTVADFANDISKIMGLTTAFRQTNVNVAMAIFKLSNADRASLNDIRNGGPSGTLKYFLYTASNTWSDVTATISTAQTGLFLLATYRAA
ncbi:MAG: hypothetical protein ABI162_06240 [Luteolibacter sp.]